MSKSERIELRVTKELRAAIDQARGDVSLNRWAERAFEKALGENQAEGSGSPPASPSRSPAPPRTLARSAPAFNRATSLKR